MTMAAVENFLAAIFLIFVVFELVTSFFTRMLLRRLFGDLLSPKPARAEFVRLVRQQWAKFRKSTPDRHRR